MRKLSIFTLKCSFWGQNRLLESNVFGFHRKGWLSGASFWSCSESGFPKIIILKVPEEFRNHLLLTGDLRICQELQSKFPSEKQLTLPVEFKFKAKIIIFNFFCFFQDFSASWYWCIEWWSFSVPTSVPLYYAFGIGG